MIIGQLVDLWPDRIQGALQRDAVVHRPLPVHQGRAGEIVPPRLDRQPGVGLGACEIGVGGGDLAFQGLLLGHDIGQVPLGLLQSRQHLLVGEVEGVVGILERIEELVGLGLEQIGHASEDAHVRLR